MKYFCKYECLPVGMLCKFIFCITSWEMSDYQTGHSVHLHASLSLFCYFISWNGFVFVLYYFFHYSRCSLNALLFPFYDVFHTYNIEYLIFRMLKSLWILGIYLLEQILTGPKIPVWFHCVHICWISSLSFSVSVLRQNLTMQHSLTLNLWSSCLCLLSTGVQRVPPHPSIRSSFVVLQSIHWFKQYI
jgi:hypothetical protein